MRKAGRFVPAWSQLPKEPGSARALAALPTGFRRLTTSRPTWFIFLRWKIARSFLVSRKNLTRGQDFLFDRSENESRGRLRRKFLLAFDLDKQSIAWSYPQVGSGHSSGGTMTTAGGLVFFGDDANHSKPWMPNRKAACGTSTPDRISALLP